MIAEQLLNALLHLFALQTAALPAPVREAARGRVLAYLRNHVGLAQVETYIGLFDELTTMHAEELAASPDFDATMLDNAAGMAARLKTLLHGFERSAALPRFLELAALAENPSAGGRKADSPGTGQSDKGSLPRRIALLLGRELGMGASRMEAVLAFIADPLARVESGDMACRLLGGDDQALFRGRLAVLRLEEPELLLVAPVGRESIRLEGHVLDVGACQPLRPGHVLRDHWGNELHHAQVRATFEPGPRGGPRVEFRGEHLDFRFPGSHSGLHDFSFRESGGRMVAVMGGSGSGKSTLLNILNGTIRPDSGRLLLNGRNVLDDPASAEGVFGFIPQDDLLFEDLTVFENLYYAARLCMAHLPEDDLAQRVRALLADLGQAGIADLKVGSPLHKTISGGQRKRLNIALELIREPTILFVDEPTSGLSSADSELVMSLLKQQAEQGRLVFVVIHQPSSKIFRMFDALWIVDQGGWPIFCGTPLEAVVFFRSRAGLPGAEDPICTGCGGVNPEQIFEIIEARLLDSSGQPTGERQASARTWQALYRDYAEAKPDDGKQIPDDPSAALKPPSPTTSAEADGPDLPGGSLHRPGRFGQMLVFLARDLRARLANRTYLAVTLLEPPLLGLLVGLVCRGGFGGEYAFHDNNNIHVFLFMSVIVALFLGLSISAEEICRDAKMLQRERFLHLSWFAYINSKSLYLALVAALQILLYLAAALPLVEMPGLFLKGWLLLAACAFASSMLGLNISASFQSAVTIYILIPLMLIPQMILSGVIITYDDLIGPHSREREVPVYANLLPARWGYEALVVEQYSGNAYMRHFLEADARLRQTEHDLDHYLPRLQSLVHAVAILRGQDAPDERIQSRLNLIRAELPRLESRMSLPPELANNLARFLEPEHFQPDAFIAATAAQLDQILAQVRRHVFNLRRSAATEKRQIEARLEQELGRDGLEALRLQHTNRSIQRQALNIFVLEPVGEADDGLFQRTLPIYQIPESPLGSAHFLAARKRLGTSLVPTYPFNLAAIFLLTLLLYLTLLPRIFPRLVSWCVQGHKS